MTTGGSLWRVPRCRGQVGYTLLELVVTIGLIGVLMAIAAPFLFSVIAPSALRAGAEEMATVLNRARQLAIKENRSVCVTSAGNRVQYFVGCGVAAWAGPGTDAAGFIQLANNIAVTNGQVTFSYIGTATLTGTYTVSNPQGGTPLNVVVAPSGRVSITP
jgi:prepilin-type N-terminal cleavage/methylation domain-containing protein